MDRYYISGEEVSQDHTHVQRAVTRSLRAQIERLRHNADALFLTLCESDKSAEVAMAELWGSGEFDCGPQDYDYIVMRCLAVIREHNEHHTKPA